MVLVVLFALGFFINAIQIVRVNAVNATVHNPDVTMAILWSLVEENVGVCSYYYTNDWHFLYANLWRAR